MDNKTKGAWILHHKNKIDNVTGVQSEFEEIILAGKCSALLSSISSTEQLTLSNRRVAALAAVAGINRKLELPNIIEILSKQRLINKGSDGIEVLALTSASILEYTTRIFEENEPNKVEDAVIDLSEKASESPILSGKAIEYVSDLYGLDYSTSSDVINRSKSIGFFDYETTRDFKELLFNGNLFRNQDITKISNVLAALSPSEAQKMKEANELINVSGCEPLENIVKLMGTDLFNKLQSIGIYDVSSIVNEIGECLFVTKPSSFCKFSSSQIDDAFDLAKAFVASLTYGMTKRSSSYGRIRMIESLMKNLINGLWVGPATAIGQDYKVLEMKGVVKVKQEANGMYSMKLLKADVGKLALAVILEGSTVSSMLSVLPSASISGFVPPEQNRSITRKQLTTPIKRSVSEILESIRTGDL